MDMRTVVVRGRGIDKDTELVRQGVRLIQALPLKADILPSGMIMRH